MFHFCELPAACFPCTWPPPSRSAESSLHSRMASLHAFGRKEALHLCKTKHGLWVGVPSRRPLVLNFENTYLKTLNGMRSWLGICCQAHGLFSSPPPCEKLCWTVVNLTSAGATVYTRAKASSWLKDDCDEHGQNLRSGGREVCKCSGGSSFCLFVCFYVKEDMGALVGSPRLLAPVCSTSSWTRSEDNQHNLIITDPCVFFFFFS